MEVALKPIDKKNVLVTSNYAGEMKDGKRHGEGTYVYENKYFRYQGEWVDNKKHGQGVFLMGDGSFYEGEMKDGEITGQGARHWADGSTYFGGFVEGELHGMGRYLGADGFQYEGEWRDNRRHGEGLLVGPNGYQYQGGFLNHKFHGPGILLDSNGERKEGTFECGVLTGHCRATYSDGSVYEGQFQQGQRHGAGKWILNDQISYEGPWEHDRPTDVPEKIVTSAQPVTAAPFPDGTPENVKVVDGVCHIGYPNPFTVHVSTIRIALVQPPPLAEEEKAAMLDRLRQESKEKDKGSKKKKAGKDSIQMETEMLKKWEEEMSLPQPQDIGTRFESGRTLSLTLWKLPVPDKKDKKAPVAEKPPTPSGRATSEAIEQVEPSIPEPPPNSEQVPFFEPLPPQKRPSIPPAAPPVEAPLPPKGAPGKKNSASSAPRKSSQATNLPTKGPEHMKYTALTVNGAATFPPIALFRGIGINDPGTYYAYIQDESPIGSFFAKPLTPVLIQLALA